MENSFALSCPVLESSLPSSAQHAFCLRAGRFLLFAAAPVLLLASGGCTLAPDYQRPQVETPDVWKNPGQDSTAAAGALLKSETEISRNWWKNFGSAELDSLMEQSLAGNNDLLAQVQRVAQARAALRIAGASLLPSADASAGATRSRSNPAQGATSYQTAIQAGVSVAYELDLFGANRAQAAAAQAGFDSSRYTQDALALVVMSDVASGYFTWLNLRERLGIADENLSIAQDVLRIVQARVKAGSDSELDLLRQKSAVDTNKAARESLVQQIENAENALALLAGRAPGGITKDLAGKDSLDGILVPSIAPGQPSSLLGRRPDLRAAESDLAAADADIGAARAAFFPSLSIGLSDNFTRAGFGAPVASVLSLASSLSAPIFHGGQLQGGLDQATARQRELVETYRKTVLTAFQDVSDALAAVRAAQAREGALKTAMTQSRRAWDLSKKRYDAGAIDFQTLLDAQSERLSAEDSYAQARLERLTAAVELYKALGCGWREEE